MSVLARSLILFSSIWLTACGTAYQDSQRYVRDSKHPESEFERKTNDFLIWTTIGATSGYTDAPDPYPITLFTDSHHHLTPPYRLGVSVGFYGNRVDPATIERVVLRHGDAEEVVLLDEPTGLYPEKWLDHADLAGWSIPLEDTLPFVAGSQVRVDVDYRSPLATTPERLTTIFNAVEKRSQISKFEIHFIHGP